MKQIFKAFFLVLLLTVLGALTLLAADAATAGTQSELTAAINAANAKTESSTATVITLTDNVTLDANKSIGINGKHVVIDGGGQYKITRSSVTSAAYLFALSGGADLTLQNVTVDTFAYAVSLAEDTNSFFTVGSGAKISSTIPTSFTDNLPTEPYLINDLGGNTVTVAAGGSVGYESSTAATRTVAIYTGGTLHLYGKVYDGVNADAKNHRLIYAHDKSAADSAVYVYEGAEVVATGNGGGSSTALFWLNSKTVVIKGGTFTATNWKNDTTTGNIPRGIMYVNTSASNADYRFEGGTYRLNAPAGSPMFVFNCVKSFTFSGGTYNMESAGALIVYENTATVNVTGGTFNHSGNSENTYGNVVKLSGAGTFHMTGGVINHTSNVTTILIEGDAVVTVGGNAKISSARYAIHAMSCSPTVTVTDNAVISTSHAGANVLRFEAGKPVVNISGNAKLLGTTTPTGDESGTTAVTYFNRTGNSIGDTDGFITLNISGTPTVESYNTCIYVETPNVTNTSSYNVLNIKGGTFISHGNFGINLKNGTRVSVKALSGATFATDCSCFNVAQVTFKEANLTFTNCTFETTGAYYINASNNHTNLRAPIRIGISDSDAVTLTSLTLNNCNLLSGNEGLSVSKASKVGSIVINTTGAGDYTYNGLFEFLNTSSLPTVSFSIGGTGTVMLSKVEITHSAANVLFNVTGTGTVTFTDCTITQSGAAHVISVTGNATVNFGGSTNITATAASCGVLYSKASPTVHVYGSAKLTSAHWTINLHGGSPVVTVDGGTVKGTYGIVYNNRTNYNPTEGGFLTVTVNGGTLETTSSDCIYVESAYTAKKCLVTVTGGTFKGQDALNVKGATVAEVAVTGGTFTALTRGIFDFQGTSQVTLDITGGTFTMGAGSIILMYGSANLTANIGAVTVKVTDAAGFLLSQTTTTVSNVTFNGTDITAAGYVISATVTAKPTVTVKGCTVSTEGALASFEEEGVVASLTVEDTVLSGNRGVVVDNGASVTLTMRENQFTTKNQTLRSYGSSTLKATFSGGKYVSTGNQVLLVTGVEGSVLNIHSGIFETTEGSSIGPLYIGGGTGDANPLVANIYGGFFGCVNGRAIRVYNTATLNIYGGTFYKDSATGSVSLIDASVSDKEYGSTLNIYGGLFYLTTPGVSVVVGNDKATVNVQGGTFHSPGNPLTNFGKGTASFNHTAGTYTTVSGLDMRSGSTLRLVSSSSGLRFVTDISKAAYDRLVAMADGGELTFGTLIMPAQYMEWAATYAKQFTRDALDVLGLQYLDVVSTSQGFHLNADGSYTVNAAIANIKEENITLSYAALSYVTFKVGGVTVTQYSNFNDVKHTRSVYQVARAAANDISDTEQGVYIYQLQSNPNPQYVGKYSPYSAEQWQIINRYWVWSDATKGEVKTIDLFGIAGQSDASGYSTMTDSFLATHKNTVYQNIFYSGATPAYLTTTVTKSDGTSTSTTKFDNSAEKLPGTTPVGVGLGWKSTQIGTEYGIAGVLSSVYNSTTGKYAGIVKFAVGNTSLSDENTTANNRYGGNWCPPSYLAEKGKVFEESGMLYQHFIYQMGSAVEDYRAMGYIVTVKGVLWFQGDTDRNKTDILTAYPEMFKALVGDMRAAFAEMTPHSTDLVEIVVAEIFCSDGADFVAMQNSFTSIEGVYIAKTSQYTETHDGAHWTCDEALRGGTLIGNCFMENCVNK